MRPGRHPKWGQLLTTGGNLGLYVTVGGGDHLLLGIEDVNGLSSYLSAQAAAAGAWKGGEIIKLK